MKNEILGIFLIILGIVYWIYCTYVDNKNDDLPNVGGYFLSVILFIAGCVLFLI